MHTLRPTSALVLLLPLCAAALFFQACSDSIAQGTDADPYEGVWEATVTVRDCTSGATLAAFRGAQMIHRGGLLSDTNSTAPATRGPGMGVWSRNGNGTYAAKFRFYRYNADGSLAGSAIVTSTRTLSADGNAYSGDTRNEIRDPAGNLLASGCVTDTGVRFQ